MGAIQRIFGRDEKFYDLLEASAAEAHSSAALLRSVLEKIGQQKATEETLADLAQSRRTHKRITQEITEKLCESFVTPLEREDIETAHVEKIQDTYERLQSIEGEADRLITSGTREIYQGSVDAKEVVF